jgi:hypothetical protein
LGTARFKDCDFPAARLLPSVLAATDRELVDLAAADFVETLFAAVCRVARPLAVVVVAEVFVAAARFAGGAAVAAFFRFCAVGAAVRLVRALRGAPGLAAFLPADFRVAAPFAMAFPLIISRCREYQRD